ncbi:FkbM family methyltransferase [Marinobacter sp.]|uniref:FkbM family methyltransferase n=1 Tax=Marinobacter sp. TaxID=50741 RepID=UPI0023573959|nr:FkbM family methyltransferase [Marinobacter sp.]
MLKKLASYLPDNIRKELKRIYYRRQINKNEFKSPELEYQFIEKYVKTGDWVIDVGANVGHYTRRFAEIVGHGRVIAFEPHPETFAMLAANVEDLGNTTLINAALSDKFGEVGFSVPHFNLYEASVDPNSHDKVGTVSPDLFNSDQSIAFIKIDAEGHEPIIIEALDELIKRHRPILMVEHNSEYLRNWVSRHRYRFNDIPNSHNHILEPD